jgi:hypothetical protein
MTDLDKRLEADGRSWRLAIGVQAPATRSPVAPTGTSWNRWLMPAAAAAALVAVTVGVFGLAHVPRARHSGPSMAAAQAALGCTISGLAAQQAPSGTTGQHSSAQAQAVAGIPASTQPRSYLAMVTDPTASKLGLGPADVARLMWVFTAQTTYTGAGPDSASVGHGPYNPNPAGTVFNDIWLVDDLTLTPAGKFACQVAGPSSARQVLESWHPWLE